MNSDDPPLCLCGHPWCVHIDDCSARSAGKGCDCNGYTEPEPAGDVRNRDAVIDSIMMRARCGDDVGVSEAVEELEAAAKRDGIAEGRRMERARWRRAVWATQETAKHAKRPRVLEYLAELEPLTLTYGDSLELLESFMPAGDDKKVGGNPEHGIYEPGDTTKVVGFCCSTARNNYAHVGGEGSCARCAIITAELAAAEQRGRDAERADAASTLRSWSRHLYASHGATLRGLADRIEAGEHEGGA